MSGKSVVQLVSCGDGRQKNIDINNWTSQLIDLTGIVNILDKPNPSTFSDFPSFNLLQCVVCFLYISQETSLNVQCLLKHYQHFFKLTTLTYLIKSILFALSRLNIFLLFLYQLSKVIQFDIFIFLFDIIFKRKCFHLEIKYLQNPEWAWPYFFFFFFTSILTWICSQIIHFQKKQQNSFTFEQCPVCILESETQYATLEFLSSSIKLYVVMF